MPASFLPLRFAFALVAAAAVMTLAVPPAKAQEAPPSQEGTPQTYVPESVALAGPPILPTDEDDPHVPPGYHTETRIRNAPVITGAALLGGLYFVSFVAAARIHAYNGYDDYGNRTARTDDGALLFVPIVGPFLQTTRTEGAPRNVILCIDGVGQVAGAALFIVGMASPRTVLVRNHRAEVHVLPMTIGTGGGAGLGGRF